MTKFVPKSKNYHNLWFKCVLLSAFFSLANQSAYSQNKVSGTVTGVDAETLIGVNILIKGTSSGTISDIDGTYSLEVNKGEVLVFSYTGFQSKEITVGDETIIDVTLVVGQELEEVIVVGYGVQKRSDVTGAVATVKAAELAALPATRVDEALKGRATGVVINNNDAAPNANVKIRIRGANSLNGGNDPLIVIDGFQGGRLNTVNPNDIESIEVLKDASATAIYGSRGANGVILITTKKGTSEKPKVTYNGFVTSSKVRKTLDLLNAQQYAQTVNDHRTELGLPTPFTTAEISGFANAGTDWQDEIFRDALAHNHVLSIAGAGKNVDYFISGNFVDREGIVQGSSYDRYSLRTNVNTKLSDRIDVTTNLFYSREVDHPTQQNSLGAGGSPILAAQLFAPTKPVFLEDGFTYSQPGGGVGPPTEFNPLALAVEPIRDNFINTFSINGTFKYEIIDGLTLSLMGGYRDLDREINRYSNGKVNNSTGTEFASIRDERTVTYQNTNLLTWAPESTGKHSYTLMAGLEQQHTEFNRNSGGGQGFLTDAVTYNNLALAANPGNPSSFKNSRSLLSYFGRATYSYAGKYSVTLTARSDGSSVFGANNKRGFFPSGAVRWNVTQEDFFNKVGAVSNLSLRASYGITGNQAIDPYQSLSQLSTTTAVLSGTSLSTGVIQSSQAGNPDLKWERTSQFNVGADMELWDGRIVMSADYYVKNTSDLLLEVPLPQTSGISNVLRNIGEVKNAGIEFSIGGTPVNIRKLKWQTGFNFNINNNEVVQLTDGETEITLGGPGLPNFGNTLWLEVGQPMGQLRGYEQIGIWSTSEEAQAAEFGSIPGAPKYRDVNNDGAITEDDITVIGNTQPDFTFGWNNTFNFGDLDLNIFIQGVQGNDVYNIGRVRSERTSGDADATSARILDRWTANNQDTDVPSFTGTNDHEQLQSSRWVEDGSYIRLGNVSLGYNLPTSVVERLNIGSVRLYVTGTNLATITDYTGFDPEASNRNEDTRAGVDLAAYPSQKSFTFGLDITF